jgi:membrane protein implicated in regulation of membrane protease activity
MKYRYKRHVTNTLLYAVIITALIAVIKQYTWWGAIIFAIVSVAALAADRYVENQHLKEEEQKETTAK